MQGINLKCFYALKYLSIFLHDLTLNYLPHPDPGPNPCIPTIVSSYKNRIAKVYVFISANCQLSNSLPKPSVCLLLLPRTLKRRNVSGALGKFLYNHKTIHRFLKAASWAAHQGNLFKKMVEETCVLRLLRLINRSVSFNFL